MRLIITLFISFIIIFSSCNNEKKQIIYKAEADPVHGLANTVILTPELSPIFITDFVTQPENLDSITYSSGETVFNEENASLEILEDFINISTISSISLWKDNVDYSVLCLKRKPVVETVKYSRPNGTKFSEVMIAGDFNSWNPNEDFMLEYKDNIWQIDLELDYGVYQYQIVVDGQWMNNDAFGDTVPNGIGGYNTLLKVYNPCPVEKLFIQTESFSENTITISYNQVPDRLFVLWQNQIIPTDLKGFGDLSYSFSIPEESNQLQRSHIRIFACKNECISNDLLIPLEYGKPVTDTEMLTRFDMHSNIMYSLMIDRFNNADKDNDKPVNDSRVAARANYQGGDLKGINEKIDDAYFSDLNISMLWISPVTQNPWESFREFPAPQRYYSGYHGYWPISSTEIDKRFGDSDSFKEMVESAHKKEINIILDFVANHVHEQHPLYKENPDWATSLILEDGRKNIRIWDEQRLTTWFDTFLPSWDFSKNEVIDTITEIAVYWITEYNLDGFRHDATKHIPEEFWRTLTYKLKKEIPDRKIYQVGETFGSRKLIGNYVGSGLLNGQFDFNLYFDARNAFADNEANLTNLAISLSASLEYYGHNHLMSNISGNHDLVRFITYADGGIKPGEDDKEAGWNRDISVENEISYKKQLNLLAFIMTIPGIPCIYYGDEFGMAGANDPDNRRMMKFSGLSPNETNSIKICKRLTKLRKSRLELIYGTTNIVNMGKNHIVYKRKYFNNISIVIISNSEQTQNINIPIYLIGDIDKFELFNNLKYTKTEDQYIFEINAHEFEILTSK
jgi:cyclomaltodextrinase / maltogenic alpha-amylase / neopullulanase